MRHGWRGRIQMTMSKPPDGTDAEVRRWKTILVLSAVFLAGFGVWEVVRGNVGNGLGMIVVPAVVVVLLLTLLGRRSRR
jgi:hypothetical protein